MMDLLFSFLSLASLSCAGLCYFCLLYWRRLVQQYLSVSYLILEKQIKAVAKCISSKFMLIGFNYVIEFSKMIIIFSH